MSNFNVSILFRLIDKVTAPARRMASVVKNTNSSFNSMKAPVQRLNEIGRSATMTAGKVAALGAGATWAFKRQFIDTAAEFERYQSILETLEGSSAKAQKSMEWINDFTNNTPFQLGQVTDAFVKMRSYGLDPTNGLLKTLGDTASAMGKSVDQAVEAIADAVTGENERLKEFGIKARTDKNQITYEFTNKDGIQEELSVAKDDRKAIENALKEIFDNKFTGAMDKQMKTWNGLMSNVADRWTTFKNMVMNAGLFDYLRGSLQGILSRVDAMAKSGQLKEIAADFGQRLVAGIKGTVEAVKTVWAIFSGFLDLIGGVKSLVAILAVILAGKFVGAIYGTVVAVKALSLAIATNPIGAMITALALGAALIITHWDTVKGWFATFFDWFKVVWDNSPIGLMIRGGKFILDKFSGGEKKEGATGGRNAAGQRNPLGQGATSRPSPILKAPGAQAATYQVDYGGINITAAPGQSEQDLAREVRKELDARDRRNAARQRGAMFDYQPVAG